MNVDRVYSAGFWIGLLIVFGLIATGILHSIVKDQRLPPIYLNYSKDTYATVIEQKDYERGIPQLKLAAKLDLFGRRPKHYFELAKAAYKARDIENQNYALRALRQIVEEGHISDARVYYYLSVALILQPDVDRDDRLEAIGLCKETLLLDDSFAPAHANLGVVWTELGDYEKAAEHFSHALRLDPTLTQARYGLQYVSGRLYKR